MDNYNIVIYNKINSKEELIGPHIPDEVDLSDLTYIKYMLNGKLHRLDGPALVERTGSGSTLRERYYINGIFYSKVEFEKKVPSIEVSDWTTFDPEKF